MTMVITPIASQLVRATPQRLEANTQIQYIYIYGIADIVSYMKATLIPIITQLKSTQLNSSP